MIDARVTVLTMDGGRVTGDELEGGAVVAVDPGVLPVNTDSDHQKAGSTDPLAATAT